jgi:hypothetical protein
MRAALTSGSSRLIPVIGTLGVAALLLLGCGSDEPDAATPTTTTTTTTTTVAPTTTAVPTTTTTAVPLEIDARSFRNIHDMTAVRGFFVDNLVGDLDATIAVAENLEGGVYPAGSVVQLFPGEAMVKREAGFSPETKDWEFFELVASAEGTEIRVRGGVEAVNQFGGSCASCHAEAAPEFDFICEKTNGCEPLPISQDLIELAQANDPRPRAE